MKKGIIIVLLLAVAAAGVYFFVLKKDKKEDKGEKQQPLQISKNSDDFNLAFNAMLADYYNMSDAFTQWDTSLVNQSANKLSVTLGKIPFDSVKADTSIIETAKSLASVIEGENKAILGETDIEAKRRSFYTLSDNLYNLIRAVRYDQAIVYQMHCPMAFNDNEEAIWLSNKNEVNNPYLGSKHPKYKSGMLHCGKMQDSIDFRQK